MAHALTYLQDPLCWWTYNATCDCRPANRGRLCLWRPANYLKLAPFKPPRPLSIHLYPPTRPLYLARFNPYSPPPPGTPAPRSSPKLRIFVAPASCLVSTDFAFRFSLLFRENSVLVSNSSCISCRTFLLHGAHPFLIFDCLFHRTHRNLLFYSLYTLPNAIARSIQIHGHGFTCFLSRLTNRMFYLSFKILYLAPSIQHSETFSFFTILFAYLILMYLFPFRNI